MSEGRYIPQSLESRTHANGAAVPLVHITVVGFEEKSVDRDALAQGCDLTADGVLTRLGFAGNAGVNGGPFCDHTPPDSMLIFGVFIRDVLFSAERRPRCGVGTRRA
ncbi:MAG: hypothetical protein C3F11_15190 [Methylocystaceae bacterium]|nr:MAG: hypothetical protein C3F11_15190 [Methylocystaceae bacterium]